MFRKLVVLAVVGVALGAPSSSKVDISLKNKSQANIAVSFTETTDAVYKGINAMKFSTKGLKISTMKAQLEQLADHSQRKVISYLENKQINFKSAWINNHLYVRGASAKLIEEIANFPEVVEVREQVKVDYNQLKTEKISISADSNIEKIEAPAAWNLPGGNKGEGIVVATLDTGCRFSHEAIRSNIRSKYNWFDAVNGRSEATDGFGTGTHVLGTILGSNGIGVAPEAKAIVCKAFDFNRAEEENLISCGEWVACPDPECNLTPDISSNSWTVDGAFSSFAPVIEAWHAANIIPVFSAGNGPQCNSVGGVASLSNVISVGSTDENDLVAPFSARGPGSDGSIKPDITAPAIGIRSAHSASDTVYVFKTGNSMSVPHVSGTVALLKSRNPNLTFNQIKTLLQNNAERNLGNSSDTCGDIPSDKFPNNIYGHGRVNAKASLEAAINNF